MNKRQVIAILAAPFLPRVAAAETAVRRIRFLGANTPQR
jgi:hypothetical protein